MKSIVSLCLSIAPFAAYVQPQPLSLSQAVQQAISSRASIRAAQLRVDEAKAVRRGLAAKPATELRVGYSSDMNVGGTDDDLMVAQPIDVFGRTSASRLSGDALVRQAEGLLRQAKIDVQSGVLDAYLESAAAAERLKFANEAEAATGQLLRAVQGLVEGGRVPGVQATRVTIELSRARANRKQREANVAASERRLSGVLGSGAPIGAEAFPDIETAPIGDEELSRQRADLLALAAERSIAVAEVSVARLGRMPQLELQGRRSPWQNAGGQYGVRVQLSFPLYDSGKARAEVAAADLRSQAAKESYADLLRMAHADMEASLIEVQSAREKLKSLQEVLNDTELLLERTQTGLKEGANTLLDTLDAMRAIREVREEIVEAKLALGRAQAKYVAATGGLLEARP